ncbi:MAG: C40 family peptidase [Clostridiales bacterium]|jgi:cell wall-associated NlpC family hydrolase|nr:C40 family peptidase [Clostridiales bacterium]
MKKITTLTIILLCLTLILFACSNIDKANNNDLAQPEQEQTLDYGAGLEIENGIESEQEQSNGLPDTKEPSFSPSSEYEVQSLVTLNIRDNPSTQGNILGVMTQSQTLPLIETLDSWHKVLYNDSMAYVSANASYSRLKPLGSQSDIVEKVIETGLSVLGTPYEYGSTRIIDYNFKPIVAFTGNTFDCSAFVQYAFYKGANINLYGDSRTMSKQGVTVKYEDIKRGDVIFMTSTARQYNTGIERIGHVGIYLGDNKLLHTYGTGGVRITEFSSFWRGRFITAKCMFKYILS